MPAPPSWIKEYVELIDQVSESPLQFNIWAAISVVSSVLKRNVWTTYKTYTIYPNQYIVLVAPPGIGKGASIHPAHSFAKDNGLINYMSDRITAPRIIERLHQGFTGIPQIVNGQVVAGAKDCSATLVSSELPTLLSSSDWMLTFLCDTWDKGEYEYDTRHKGSFNVTNMCVSLIGACVPDYIRKINKDASASVSSGFSARTVFVNAKAKSKTLAWGDGFSENPKYKPVIENLKQRLQKIATLSGEMQLDPYAMALWNKFYQQLSDSYNPDDSDVYNNFRARQHVHVLKVAMTLAASEESGLTITHSILSRAIALVENIAEGVDEIFRGVGESDISAGLARIELYIERKSLLMNGHGPPVISFPQLLADNIKFIDHDDLVKIMKVLELIGFVTSSLSTTGTYLYTWTGKRVTSTSKVII